MFIYVSATCIMFMLVLLFSFSFCNVSFGFIRVLLVYYGRVGFLGWFNYVPFPVNYIILYKRDVFIIRVSVHVGQDTFLYLERIILF